MKWLCLTAFVLVILLGAYAGFQLMTVSPQEVEAARTGTAVSSVRSDAPRTTARTTSATRDTAPRPESGADSPAAHYGSTLAEQAPALNVGAFGVDRERGRLAEIERGRQAASDQVEETFGD